MRDLFDNVDDPLRDLGRSRIVADFGNNKVTAIETDPYGFWHLKYDRGKIPAELDGHFTTFDQAKKAAEVYFKKVGKPIGDK